MKLGTGSLISYENGDLFGGSPFSYDTGPGDKARYMLAFSTDYISVQLAGKGPGCGATLFSLIIIGMTRTSKVQLHR